MAGEVEEGAAAVEKGGAQGVVETAEGDRLEPSGASGVGDRAAHMGAADRLGEQDARGWDGEARLGIAGAERRQLLDESEELAGRTERRDGAVDGELRRRRLGADRRLDARSKELAQRADLALLDGEAGCHGVSAAIDQQAFLACRDDGGAERDAADRAARPLADAVLDGDNARRPVVALLETAGDDADDARVPVRAGGEDDRRGRVAQLDLGDCRSQHAGLDLASLGVEIVELTGEVACQRRIAGRQEAGAEPGAADAAAGIGARPDAEAGLAGADAPGGP